MISKLVVWGEDRADAVNRMRRALDEYQVRGIETNLPFHRRCLRNADFIAGVYDTGFIGRNAASLSPRADFAEGEPLSEELFAALAAIALDATVVKAPAASQVATAPNAESAWRGRGRGWRDAG